MKKIIVLISGQGSNLQAIIDHCEKKNISAKIVAVFSNNPQAYGLQRAKNHAIPTYSIESKTIEKSIYHQKLFSFLQAYQPDLIVLAGYMLILPKTITDYFAFKIVNIHPSLLPKYKGLNTHTQVIQNKEIEHGCTVHFVNDILDSGSIILQSKFSVIYPTTSLQLQKKVQEREHIIYPMVIQWYCNGNLSYKNNTLYLNDNKIPQLGLIFENIHN